MKEEKEIGKRERRKKRDPFVVQIFFEKIVFRFHS
jgi:hypothetical protein